MRNEPMTRLKLAGVVLAMALGLSISPTAAAQDDNTGIAEADAGSLGLTLPFRQWCLADAGSLGLDDPVRVCQ